MLSVGYGEDELTRADAFRVYRDAEDVTPSTSSASPLSSGVASTGDVSPDWTTMSPFERVERVVLPPDRDTVGTLTRRPQALSRCVRDFQDEADGKADGKSRLTFAQS
jgi:hypothetical protein